MKNLYSFLFAFLVLMICGELRGQGSLCIPAVSTTAAGSIATDSVVIGGDIMHDGGSAIVLRGVCYSLTSAPDMSDSRTQDGLGIGVFSTVLRGLTAGTTYYARSYAKNAGGLVAYGNEVTFTTLSPVPSFSCGTTSITDVDGNSYATVQIGTQCWTQSNLTVSKYRNGDIIPNITDDTQWSQTNTGSTGAWCNYNNDANIGTTFGKLYNWYAVNDSRGLCPTGWHVPSDAEWTTLENHLGGSSVAGGAMKSQTGWFNNGNATNSSGFNGLPGGVRGNFGGFGDVGFNGYWWSSSVAGSVNAWYRQLFFFNASVLRSYDFHGNGFSVRCARD